MKERILTTMIPMDLLVRMEDCQVFEYSSFRGGYKALIIEPTTLQFRCCMGRDTLFIWRLHKFSNEEAFRIGLYTALKNGFGTEKLEKK